MEIVYVVMRGHWIDMCSYSGDPETTELDSVYKLAGEAMDYIINEANSLVASWRAKDHDETGTEDFAEEQSRVNDYDIFELIAYRGNHEYVRFWIEQKEVH